MSPGTTEQTEQELLQHPGHEPGRPRGGSDEAVIFLHLPKTAGTTLNRLIEWEYPLSQMYSIDPVLFEWSAAHLRRLPKRRLGKTRMFKGHMLFGLHEVLPQPATYITVLRDPVERVLSAFYYMRTYKLHPLYWNVRREKWTIEEFVESAQRAIMSNAKSSLERSITPRVRGDSREGQRESDALFQCRRTVRAL